MSAKFNHAALIFSSVPAEEALDRREEPMRTHRTLMDQLEASLAGSRQALLALDLAGIERGTREQVVLAGEIEAALRRAIARPAAPRASAEHSAEQRMLRWSARAADLQELRRSENRVLAAARLQAALLVRVQCKLRVLANFLAGPSVNYGPLSARNVAPLRVFSWKRPGEI
jgi:hypothetical protein